MLSCKKKTGQSDRNSYGLHITGVRLYDEMGLPAGTLGNPDVNADGFQLNVFPNPAVSLCRAVIVIDNKEPVQLTLQLIHDDYLNPPSGTVVQNMSLDGNIAWSKTMFPDIAPADTITGGIHNPVKGQTVLSDLEVGPLPRGILQAGGFGGR